MTFNTYVEVYLRLIQQKNCAKNSLSLKRARSPLTSDQSPLFSAIAMDKTAASEAEVKSRRVFPLELTDSSPHRSGLLALGARSQREGFGASASGHHGQNAKPRQQTALCTISGAQCFLI